MSLQPMLYVRDEGGEWLGWPSGFKAPTEDELRRAQQRCFRVGPTLRARLFSDYPEYGWHATLELHAIRFSDDRIWDVLNGWRSRFRPLPLTPYEQACLAAEGAPMPPTTQERA